MFIVMQVTISTADKPKTETPWQKDKEEDAMNDMNEYAAQKKVVDCSP